MSSLDRFVDMLENPVLFAIVASALDEYRALIAEHRDTFTGGPEADYFERSLAQIDELRAALWD